MSNNIVTVNVYDLLATAASSLQRAGVIISQGGTTASANNSTAYLSSATLTAAIVDPAAITSYAWASDVVTVTTTAAHGIATTTQFWAVISGATPAGYNGTYLCTSTGTNTFTYALTTDPGTETVMGTWQPLSAVELTQFVNTFYQSPSANNLPIYVLELGFGTPAAGITSFGTWLTNNAGVGVPYEWYVHIVPRKWADESTFVTLVKNYTSNTSKKYFFTTADLSNYTDFAGVKSVVSLVESSDADISTVNGELSIAAPAYNVLQWNPSSTRKVTPLAFSDLYGVTAYPLRGNVSTLASLKAAYVNYVDTGAEGGSTNAILKWGTSMDGNPFNYWHSVDWAQINGDLAIAAEIYAGSTTSTANPIFYNQAGIDRLQDALATKLTEGQSANIIYGDVVKLTLSYGDFQTVISEIKNETSEYLGYTVINAEPMASYSARNPTHYALGRYSGIGVVFTPARNFQDIIVNMYVANFVA